MRFFLIFCVVFSMASLCFADAEEKKLPPEYGDDSIAVGLFLAKHNGNWSPGDEKEINEFVNAMRKNPKRFILVLDDMTRINDDFIETIIKSDSNTRDFDSCLNLLGAIDTVDTRKVLKQKFLKIYQIENNLESLKEPDWYKHMHDCMDLRKTILSSFGLAKDTLLWNESLEELKNWPGGELRLVGPIFKYFELSYANADKKQLETALEVLKNKFNIRSDVKCNVGWMQRPCDLITQRLKDLDKKNDESDNKTPENKGADAPKAETSNGNQIAKADEEPLTSQYYEDAIAIDYYILQQGNWSEEAQEKQAKFMNTVRQNPKRFVFALEHLTRIGKNYEDRNEDNLFLSRYRSRIYLLGEIGTNEALAIIKQRFIDIYEIESNLELTKAPDWYKKLGKFLDIRAAILEVLGSHKDTSLWEHCFNELKAWQGSEVRLVPNIFMYLEASCVNADKAQLKAALDVMKARFNVRSDIKCNVGWMQRPCDLITQRLKDLDNKNNESDNKPPENKAADVSKSEISTGNQVSSKIENVEKNKSIEKSSDKDNNDNANNDNLPLIIGGILVGLLILALLGYVVLKKRNA